MQAMVRVGRKDEADKSISINLLMEVRIVAISSRDARSDMGQGKRMHSFAPPV